MSDQNVETTGVYIFLGTVNIDWGLMCCFPEWHWSGLYLLHHPRQFEHKLWTKRMEYNVPKASWQETSRRDMHLQRASHRQGFVGRCLLCTMAVLCQGMLSPPVPKHLKKKIRIVCQSDGEHHCCTALQSSSCLGSYEIMKLFHHHAWW